MLEIEIENEELISPDPTQKVQKTFDLTQLKL